MTSFTLQKLKTPCDIFTQNIRFSYRSNTCPCCGVNIKKNELSLKRLARLKRNLMSYVESTIALKSNTRISDVDRKRRNTKIRDVIQRQADHYGFYDTLVSSGGTGMRSLASTKHTVAGNEAIFSTLGKLEEYLDENGPFDVVIDALNIGYYTKGFNPLQVSRSFFFSC